MGHRERAIEVSVGAENAIANAVSAGRPESNAGDAASPAVPAAESDE
jgi:hypothetical protein